MTFTLMRTLLYLALTVLLFAPLAAPAADEARVQNTIDLSHWKLTLPVSASGAPAGHPLEIPAAQLSAGYTNAEYFHRGADGQLVFWCPVTGARTENTEYSRCELREVVNPADYNVFKLDPSWVDQTLYFKVGVYPQDNEGPATEGARVSFSKLKVSHSDAPSPASGSTAK
jgi:hypothetical protein